MTRRGGGTLAPTVLTILLFGGLLSASTIPLGPTAVSAEGATGVGCSPGSGLSLNVTPSSGSSPLRVVFSISDPRGAPSWVNWTFGDGSPPAGAPGSSYLSTAHTYSLLGLFEAVVNISQGAGSLLCAAAIEVNPPPFSAVVHASPQRGIVPLTVHFHVNLTGGTTSFQSAQWTFGDGSIASGFNVSYTYTAAGNYTATFTAVDSANQSAGAPVDIQVNSSNVPIDSHAPPGSSPLALWLGGAAVVAAVLVGIALFLRWRVGPGTGSGTSEDRPPGTEPAAGGITSSLAGGAPDPPNAPVPSIPLFAEFGPSVHPLPLSRSPPETPVASVESELELTPARASDAGELHGRPAVEEPRVEGPPRLKLSQRVMLHLYLQGHLEDGEVAPIGFTQGGMADKLVVAQSPLSSVLRRLVVAGLVQQDTRHVRGQPRRLRVYRLTPVGDVVARDLYRHSLEGDSSSHRDD